jgi:nitronate monooxygenase
MLPRVIQGGMGVGVSGWALAREVASLGQLGVVSGTALDTILVRRLASGDTGGHLRRAIAAFPSQDIAEWALARYFRPEDQTDALNDLAPDAAASDDPEAGGSTGENRRYPLLALPRARLTIERQRLLVLANFVEVYLAKEGHSGAVGINYLHKIQFTMLPSLYGAMLAGVDVVLVGAGIPGDVPGALDRLSRHEAVSTTLDVLNSGDERHELHFDPAAIWKGTSDGAADSGRPPIHKPRFLAIVSSATLARALLKRAPGGIDGFVVETPIAGGHNAPPRGGGGLQQLSARGEPVYGDRDAVDPQQMVALGVPFWLAGGYGTREKLQEAITAGAHGIQVGTAFAFCEESGLDPALRAAFIRQVLAGETEVFTDPAASPTSFPFKVAALAGTLSEADVYADRPRHCDLGYLRRAYRREDGTLGYRCPAEPEEDYVRKGGLAEDTVGRKCLCNSLMANIGLGQRRPAPPTTKHGAPPRDGYEEPPLLTAGNDLLCIRKYIPPPPHEGASSYHARDVIASLLPPDLA